MALAPTTALAQLSMTALRRTFPVSTQSSSFVSFTSGLQRLSSASITVPAITINLPGLVSDIWEGILKAVPKKKTSHMKKRHRQLAGKALKDVKSINTCPGCGKPKKAHHLCPYCVAEIQQGWKQAAKSAQQIEPS